VFPYRTQLFDSLKQLGQATGHEQHGVWGIDFSTFVNAQPLNRREPPSAGMDLRLRPESEAIDAGMVLPNITDGFAGKAPDLGVCELGCPMPHYGPRKPD